MTAPEPTAVERTIAEVDEAHGSCRLIGNPAKPTGWLCRCEVESASPAERKMHRAQAVVAAIRNLPPEQMAELIGGAVWRNGGAPPYIAPRERVVGPWREVRDPATPARDLTPGVQP